MKKETLPIFVKQPKKKVFSEFESSLLKPRSHKKKREDAGGVLTVAEPKILTTDLTKTREESLKKVNENLDAILQAQIDAATGLRYIGEDGVSVYKKVPNPSAGEYLLNQLIGKPKESIEIQTRNLNIDI